MLVRLPGSTPQVLREGDVALVAGHHVIASDPDTPPEPFSIERVRTTLAPLRPQLAAARQELAAQLDELLALLEACVGKVTPHLPQEAESDDDDYF